ncbi:MAG: hypothetical protein SFU99_09625 [Saprospiraceae bacterium]|nr:hypothetical protein [Saprospiraceae bacterium]
MQFVSEEILDKIVERFDDSESAYEKAVEQFELSQPILLSYLFSEDFEVFTSDEKEFMLLLATIIFSANQEVNGTRPQIDEKAIADAEEANWAKLEGANVSRFHERLDIFFKDYEQEDLLAFVEDALADDDEDPIVTKEAREAMFVTLKTVIDCLTKE